MNDNELCSRGASSSVHLTNSGKATAHGLPNSSTPGPKPSPLDRQSLSNSTSAPRKICYQVPSNGKPESTIQPSSQWPTRYRGVRTRTLTDRVRICSATITPRPCVEFFSPQKYPGFSDFLQSQNGKSRRLCRLKPSRVHVFLVSGPVIA